VLAGIVFQHESIEFLIGELSRNPSLLQACGFYPTSITKQLNIIHHQKVRAIPLPGLPRRPLKNVTAQIYSLDVLLRLDLFCDKVIADFYQSIIKR
jgi:hypothetical protein